MGVRRNVGQSSGVVGNQHDIGYEAHHITMKRVQFSYRLGCGAMLGQMVEAIHAWAKGNEPEYFK